MNSAIHTSDRAVQATQAVLDRLLEHVHPRQFAVRFWNGQILEPEAGHPARFTLVLNHPGALSRMLWPPSDLTLGEAYVRGDFDVEGDFIAAFELGDHFTQLPVGWAEGLRLIRSLPRGKALDTPLARQAARLHGEKHSKARDQAAVRYHYDVGNDFYRLWLDRRLVYSCALFPTGEESLDRAQEIKLDYLCRKLRLQPGERLLDIGCGWGGLVTFAAERYGVHALGVTLSPAQAELANERIAEQGLSDRCRVELADYRDVDEQFDKIVSVGMFEHVGQAQLPVYFQKAWNLLKGQGVFLNHGITQGPGPRRPAGWVARTLFKQGQFMQRYVFPDSELEPIHVSLAAAHEVGFELRDVESLREHYALTLRHWVKNLEAQRDRAIQATNEAVYRIWRLYMAGSAYQFERGGVNVYQALFVKPHKGRSGLPLTRADWYERPLESAAPVMATSQ